MENKKELLKQFKEIDDILAEKERNLDNYSTEPQDIHAELEDLKKMSDSLLELIRKLKNDMN